MKNIRYTFLILILALNCAFAEPSGRPTLPAPNLPVLALNCAFEAPASSTSLDEINAKWISSIEAGDTNELMALYAENAVVFPPSSEILEGVTAIDAYFRDLKNAGFNKYSIANVDLQANGTTAYATALWEAVRIDVDGNKIKLGGNITNVMERQDDGNWKIKFQSWN